MNSAWRLIKTTIENWIAHKDARQGAALAYYSVFSVGPLMVIAVGIAGLAFGQDAAAMPAGIASLRPRFRRRSIAQLE
jgi:uncharacterized BrkB/YihY/UPF0761 family membrane protein